jgi:uncharacterized protein YndB with AHSA1/START domain
VSNGSGGTRTDIASRVIRASRQVIYRAFVDPHALVSWLPPNGMTGKIHHFDLRAGGSYRMVLTYRRTGHAVRGKSSEDSDVVEGRYLEIVPNQRIVQEIAFESDDPAFAGRMRMTWQLNAVQGGTEVTIRCENVPSGIAKEDHDAGLRSTLANLAAFTES